MTGWVSDLNDIEGSREQSIAQRLAVLAAGTPINEELRRTLLPRILTSEAAGHAAAAAQLPAWSVRHLRPGLVLIALALCAAVTSATLFMRQPTIATARSVEAIASVELLRLTDYDGYLSAAPARGQTIVEKDGGLWLLAEEGRLKALFTPPQGSHARQPAVSPDGKRVAFSHSTGGTMGISTIALDGTGLVRVTSPGSELVFDSDPAWSPDGSKIAFTRSMVTGMNPVTIDDSVMIVAAAGTDEPAKFASGTDPTWSAGGERLVFSRRTGASGAGTELVLASLDGLQTTSLGQGSEPAWSPGGEIVAYVRSAINERVVRTRADGSPWLVVQEWSREVWAVNVLTRAQFRLTTSTPAPDLDLDAWRRAAEAAGPPETGQVIAVVEGDHSDLHPAWGEDGRTLLFVRCAQPMWSSAGAFSVCRLTLRLR